MPAFSAVERVFNVLKLKQKTEIAEHDEQPLRSPKRIQGRAAIEKPNANLGGDQAVAEYLARAL